MLYRFILPLLISFLTVQSHYTTAEDITPNPAREHPPLIGEFGNEELVAAAYSIVQQIDTDGIRDIALVYSEEKEPIAAWVAYELQRMGIPFERRVFADTAEEQDNLRAEIINRPSDRGLIVLVGAPDAPFLFEVVGRPDSGIKVPTDHLFCDWIMDTASLIRLHSADPEELHAFRRALLDAVEGAKSIHITADAGTDVTLTPRSWITEDGETYTAPLETQTQGTIVVDGCAYYGPPESVFTLFVENGRVINADDLDTRDQQQEWVAKDLTRDENANVVAELGIGTSINSRWDTPLMESEQARGTCHFGFGRNDNYGGQNISSYHFDLVIRNPTISVDGTVICRDGVFVF